MTAWLDSVHTMPTRTLDEVTETVALQTRVDRKYILRPHTWQALLGSLEMTPSVLEIEGRRCFRYESTYYDTPGLDSYRDAARGRPQRYKVRTRHYLDTGTAAVEVKVRSRTGTTAKSRQWLEPGTPAGAASLPVAAAAFVATFDLVGGAAQDLSSVLTTSYERVTLVTTDARVTVDQHVKAADALGPRMDYGDLLIVETKSSGGAGAVDRALWAGGSRPARISKYCTSLAALRQDLPSNRWSRTLRRHVHPPAALGTATQKGLT